MGLENWREEKQSAWLYRELTRAEREPRIAALFAELADMAEAQARIWEKRLRAEGAPPPPFRPSLRARLVAALARWLGPRRIRPVLAAMKVRGLSAYGGGPLRPLDGHPMPRSVSDIGHRHKGIDAGGNLRAAVFGVNDGLVSNASLILGVLGATDDLRVVLLSGVAGLLAGAFSMAAGEYVSVRSQRELFEYQIALEREELEEYPLEEQQELALIYKARGLEPGQAEAVAARLMEDREQALDVLAREELGLNPEELGSPWGAAWSSFLSFAGGGLMPLLPVLLAVEPVTGWVVAVTLGSLFAVGALLSLFTGRPAWRSGLRMTLIGGGVGLITYLTGTLLGAGLF